MCYLNKVWSKNFVDDDEIHAAHGDSPRGWGESLPRGTWRGWGWGIFFPTGTGMGRHSPTGNSPLTSGPLSDAERASWVDVVRDENRSDTDGYHRYYICFHISVRIRIRIRIVSTMSDRIRLDIDIINMRFEYSDTDTVSDVGYPDSDTDISQPL